jgi:hypothetical protein
MHGGRSPGPRTPEGREKVRAAHTIHGRYGAKARADNRFRTTLRCISRVDAAALLCQAYLPPALAVRHRHQNPPELLPPPRPNGGITAAQDRAMRHAVAASLAPWRAAIAQARATHLAARAAARAAQPHAPVRARPQRDAGAAQPHAPVRARPQRAAGAAQPPAPSRRPTPHAPRHSPACHNPLHQSAPAMRTPPPHDTPRAMHPRSACQNP